MPEPLPRSYAALIGGLIRDARVVTAADGGERLVIELDGGAEYELTVNAERRVEVSERVAPTAEGSRASSADDFSIPAGLQGAADAVRGLLRDF